MKIIKRNGEEVEFNPEKIRLAIEKANQEVEESARVSKIEMDNIVETIEGYCNKHGTQTVEQIQDMVEEGLWYCENFKVGKQYITYRYKRELARKSNTTDETILSIVENKNAEAKEENSNKNADLLNVQRDYIAGEVSKDVTKRILLPSEVVKAHEDGIIHFHDADYFIQKMHNCDLVNLEDMLQNGTVISDTKIEKPHSFSTACNIATQIIAQVASSQYGGQSVSLAHLAPFVDVSRKALIEELREEWEETRTSYSEANLLGIANQRLAKEVKKGIQTIQYQLLTLQTTNG